MNNPLILFLSETLSRLSTKSPKFFRVYKYISGVVIALTGIPSALEYWQVVLPHPFNIFANQTAGIAATVAFIMASLPVNNITIGQTETGPVKQVDAEKLPFTATEK